MVIRKLRNRSGAPGRSGILFVPNINFQCVNKLNISYLISVRVKQLFGKHKYLQLIRPLVCSFTTSYRCRKGGERL